MLRARGCRRKPMATEVTTLGDPFRFSLHLPRSDREVRIHTQKMAPCSSARYGEYRCVTTVICLGRGAHWCAQEDDVIRDVIKQEHRNDRLRKLCTIPYHNAYLLRLSITYRSTFSYYVHICYVCRSRDRHPLLTSYEDGTTYAWIGNLLVSRFQQACGQSHCFRVIVNEW